MLDGELLAWDLDQNVPAPFAELQRRLGRKKVGPKLRREVPVIFMAYDALELDGIDLRDRSSCERRGHLEAFASVGRNAFRISPLVGATSWELIRSA